MRTIFSHDYESNMMHRFRSIYSLFSWHEFSIIYYRTLFRFNCLIRPLYTPGRGERQTFAGQTSNHRHDRAFANRRTKPCSGRYTHGQPTFSGKEGGHSFPAYKGLDETADKRSDQHERDGFEDDTYKNDGQ